MVKKNVKTIYRPTKAYVIIAHGMTDWRSVAGGSRFRREIQRANKILSLPSVGKTIKKNICCSTCGQMFDVVLDGGTSKLSDRKFRQLLVIAGAAVLIAANIWFFKNMAFVNGSEGIVGILIKFVFLICVFGVFGLCFVAIFADPHYWVEPECSNYPCVKILGIEDWWNNAHMDQSFIIDPQPFVDSYPEEMAKFRKHMIDMGEATGMNVDYVITNLSTERFLKIKKDISAIKITRLSFSHAHFKEFQKDRITLKDMAC